VTSESDGFLLLIGEKMGVGEEVRREGMVMVEVLRKRILKNFDLLYR